MNNSRFRIEITNGVCLLTPNVKQKMTNPLIIRMIHIYSEKSLQKSTIFIRYISICHILVYNIKSIN